MVCISQLSYDRHTDSPDSPVKDHGRSCVGTLVISHDTLISQDGFCNPCQAVKCAAPVSF